MEAKKLMSFMFLLTFVSLLYTSTSSAQDREIYIVHLSPQENVPVADLQSWYNSFLLAIDLNVDFDVQRQMIYTYRNVFTGFAAKLSPLEVKAMEKMDGFVYARPQRVLSLQTTHSPNFLGLHQNLGVWEGSNYGRGLIIGLLDSGITPFHPSFGDEGMPSPPAKWKGKCEFTHKNACNNKLIGARNFVNGSSGPVDENGHGTHTASTAAGNFVRGANVFGNANGTAVGIAPLAHVAMYKVCGGDGSCREIDMLAALDAAIEDGVDVISISIGGPSEPFFEQLLAVGAFAAMQKGIFVSMSAGNEGPFKATLANEAPWVLTVGASTIDRKIKATAFLGSQESFEGETLYQPKDFQGTFLPLVFPGKTGDQNARWCVRGSLDTINVQGKVVLCEIGHISSIAKGQIVKDAGGAAMILVNNEINGASTFADAHVLPAVHVGFNAGKAIKAYLNSTTSPVASIQFQGTVIGDVSAPQVTYFSSRGPSIASPGILKPDIIGPGVNILAAWNQSIEHKKDSKANFNVISGTSMSCPHLAGIATLLKSAHPSWSPAAIKSAIMTTADLVSLNKQPITDERELKADLFAIGAGHVNPSKAMNPGLVYDIQPDDYIPYLCGLGYRNQDIGIIVGKNVTCKKNSSIPEAELNYPSFAISLGFIPQLYTRTVTNVGEAVSSYNVEIFPPQGVIIDVKPSRLDFSATNQKLSYEVRFIRGYVDPRVRFLEGYLKWTSADHFVRSPISIKLV